jgi:hypothetical protein
MAIGGSHRNFNGESYSAPFIIPPSSTAGCWSVMLVPGIMAITSYCWKHRRSVWLSAGRANSPFIPIPVKETWALIDMLVFWVFLIGPGYLWPKPDELARVDVMSPRPSDLAT